MPLGFGIGGEGEITYGGIPYPVETTLAESFTIKVSVVTEEEKCQDFMLKRLLRRLNRVWRKQADDGSTTEVPTPITVLPNTPEHPFDWIESNPVKMATSSESNKLFRNFAYHLCQLLTDWNEALSMLNLKTAVGKWLDAWGRYFGAKRYTAEQDDPYRTRIEAALNKPKCTKRAILDRVSLYLGDPPSWTEFMYDGVPGTLFTPGSVEDFQRRRARAQLGMQSQKPPPKSFYISNAAETIRYNFIAPTVFDPVTMNIHQSYMSDENQIKTFGLTFNQIKDIVENTKMAGIRIFYQIDGVYVR
jgi:hypothetical protein